MKTQGMDLLRPKSITRRKEPHVAIREPFTAYKEVMLGCVEVKCDFGSMEMAAPESIKKAVPEHKSLTLIWRPMFTVPALRGLYAGLVRFPAQNSHRLSSHRVPNSYALYVRSVLW